MKDTTTFLPSWTMDSETNGAKGNRANAIIELFKKSQRLPLVSRLMKKNSPHHPPPDGMDMNSFYRL